MATYESLSAEDRGVVDNFTNVLRAACGEAARLFNHLAAIQADANAVGIFQGIEPAATVPNRSGLAGADSMTRSELQAIYVDLMAMLATHNTAGNRSAWTKACGIANMIG